MNFYEHQDRAQNRTKLIVFLFFVAVFCIVAIIVAPVGFLSEWDIGTVLIALVVCLLIIGGASLCKLIQLRGGGSTVAEMLGGVPISLHGKNNSEQRVQNIVEEMAIASGSPVPQLYIVEDSGINAFAAGWSADDAVIGVTRGCIEKLNRDELQGVIAHEFSHISHGDTRINIRLIGVIFGIMAIGITGWVLVRFVGPAVLRSSSRSRSKEGAGGAAIGLGIIVGGLFLALCGAVGTFFGRMIQAAVSRQREFLADASAVQYTRNPEGIGGALRKIGGLTPMKRITSDVSQCNHIYFSQAMRAVFASHPPIEERIARVEGIDVSTLDAPDRVYSEEQSEVISSFSSSSVERSVAGGAGAGVIHMECAKSVIKKINPFVREAISDPWSARIVIYALLARNNDESLQLLKQILSSSEFGVFTKLAPIVASQGPIVRLPLIDLAAPVLRRLSKPQKDLFIKAIIDVSQADKNIDFVEWMTITVLKKHLYGGDISKTKTRGAGISLYVKSLSVLLGMLAYSGTRDDKNSATGYTLAMEFLGLEFEMPSINSCTLKNIQTAIGELRSMKFVDRQLYLRACVICASSDGKITIAEGEAIRVIGDSLDCPIPLFQ